MVSELLQRGPKNGISLSKLAGKLGISEREVRQRVHDERIEGAMILSGNKGYYLPSEDPAEALEELRNYEKRMHSNAISTLAAAKEARAARIRLENMMNAGQNP